jgi:tRNA-specific adenosine deaminase 1
MWKAAVQVAGLAAVPVLAQVLGKRTYREVKDDEVFDARKRVKEDVTRSGLKGWVKNTGDDEFGM